MNRLIFLIVVVLLSGNGAAFAQKKGQARIDSLIAEIPKQKADTSRVNLLNEIGYSSYKTSPAEGLKYAQQALDLARKIGWKQGVADAQHTFGVMYWGQSDYPRALEAYFEALNYYDSHGSLAKRASTLANISLTYTNQKEYKKALEYGEKAMKMNLANKDTASYARGLGNIGNIHKHLKDFDKALSYYKQAIELDEEKGYGILLATVLVNTADIYTMTTDYSESLPIYLKALKLHESMGNKRGRVVAMANLAECYRHIAEDSVVKSRPDSLVKLGKAALYEKSIYYLKQSADLAKEIGFKEAFISIEHNLSEIYVLLGNYKEGFDRYKQFVGYQDSIFSAENQVKIAKLETEREVLVKNKQIEIDKLAFANAQAQVEINELAIAEQDKEIQINQLGITNKDKQIELDKLAVAYQEKQIETDRLAVANKEKQIQLAIAQKRTERAFYLVGIGFLLLSVGFIFSHYRSQKRSNVLLGKEKKKSDDLLLNILPSEVATELKHKGSAEAKYFDHVTILFTDFVNFTGAGERMNSQELIDELDSCFKAFDEIISKYNIEKIKTIGDAYLAVSGLPVPDALHAENVVRAALEIREFMRNRLRQLGDRTFEIRIGVHSGSVVAGIVGVKKFAYDIWGDTVNTAARMEQNSLPDKINISQSTYDLVHEKFECSYRGEIEAKNKGQLSMYFLEKIKTAVPVAEMG
jgi:class 3 adenylate cyclase/tetratricopeptide (TPR) repeat protein